MAALASRSMACSRAADGARGARGTWSGTGATGEDASSRERVMGPQEHEEVEGGAGSGGRSRGGGEEVDEEEGGTAGGLPPVALVCTGSLTNAALLVSLYPHLRTVIRVRERGGGGGQGGLG